MNSFIDKIVVVTEKMDGENTTLTNKVIYARSVDSKDHLSRHWIKNLWSQIKHDIPKSFRICGENLFAMHSIYYDNLESYFLVFNIWNNDICLSWSDTEDYCKLLNLSLVPVLYVGIYSEPLIKDLYKIGMEGYVIRLFNSFTSDSFNTSIVKFVRKNHVTTSDHWMYEQIFKNNLKET